MQINDINNLEVGAQDKSRGIGIDAAFFKDKIHTNQSIAQQDHAKIDKEGLGVVNMSDLTYKHPNNNTIMDELDKDLGADGKVNSASNLSQRNYDAMQELGFDAKDMDEKEFVDIADKIRIAMAKGGADISMMGDVSSAAIEQSGSYTNAIEHALKEAQLPSDKQLVDDSVLALREVDEMPSKLSDETIKYMLSNELEPTIDNIYKATVSSNYTTSARELELKGDTSSMVSQFKDILQVAGLEASEENIKDCFWMVSNRVSVTPEQLLRLQELREFTLADTNEIITNITDAVAEGKKPGDAYLMPGYSDYARSRALEQGVLEATEDIIDDITDSNEPVTVGNVARFALQNAQANASNSAEKEAYESALKEIEKLNTYGVEETVVDNNIAVNNTLDAKDAPSILDNNITYKKQLVQIQLIMSTEANYALSKRGFSIDTMLLQEYIDSIEELERSFLDTMLSDKATPEAVKNLSDSMDAVTKSKSLPDYAMPLDAQSMTLRSYASISISYSEEVITQDDTIDASVQKEASEKSIQANFSAKFNQAADYYEASATEVRRDLGDSIRKAFRNVDNLLGELNMDLTDENRRAVRILGYNQMEITAESVKEVKATDYTVTRALENLKPGVVCEMIKSGMNPLDMTMEELLQHSEEIMQTMEVSSEEEKYAEFLYRLEQENGITEDEREGFIGVYRLIHQVNKSDGAAIGMLLEQGAQVTMRNLLTATRTAKHENREYTIDDDFGGIEGFNKDSLSITDQIEMSIQSVSMRKVEDTITPAKLMQFNSENEYMSLTPEQLSTRLNDMDADPQLAAHEQEVSNAYNNMRREELLQSYKADRQVLDYLKSLDMPFTSNNINAITQLMAEGNSMMRTLLNRAAKRQVGLDREGSYASEVGMEAEDTPKTLDEEIDDIIANLIHEYGESVKTPEDMADAQRRLEELAENVMKNMIVEEDVRSIDVRGMHLIQTELHTQGEISKRSENYIVPIMVADEVGNLNLKIVRGSDKKGLVDIAFDMEKTGQVTASFRYEAGSFIGEVNCDRENTRQLLERNREALNRAISANSDADANISFEWSKKVDANNFILSESQIDFDTVSKEEAMSSNDETQAVLTKSLYGIARAFIEELGNL
ncbi:MAG TPA: hypothetical protein DCR12_07025 [Lachnospiraceae bacterium]|nr:hypothetical protein [Lachnospiraceae bacterium]